MDEQLEFMKLITSRLNSVGIPYMMTGSMAMAIYSIPRMTRDIDLVVELEPVDVDKILNLFSEDCYIDRDSVRQAVDARSMFNIIHNEWVVKADFIIRKREEYRREEFPRRQKIMNDTSSKMKQIYNEMLLSKSPLERLRMASRMYASVQRLAISGLLKEKQNLDPSKLRGELFLRIYGNDFSVADRERIMEKIPNMQFDTDSYAAGQLQRTPR